MSIAETHRQITADEIAHTFEEESAPKVDLSVYAFEDWVALAIFWVEWRSLDGRAYCGGR